jgi:predicted RNA polymerase sigma factor
MRPAEHRLDDTGALVPLLHQDRSRWDQALLAEGHRLLEQSAVGTELTEYHLEAAIASVHACAARVEETDWGQIVSLYDTLMKLRPSPVVALNRAIAIGQYQGPELGLQAVQSIEGRERLATYPFHHAALAELELRRGNAESAACHFREAIALARNEMERRFLTQRLGACDAG